MNLSLPPALKVRIDGSVYTLDTTSPIGDGGEAVVIKQSINGKNYAIKIIHPIMRNPARVRKLEAQINRKPPLPDRAVKPLKPVYDAMTNELIGHCMELIQIDRYDDLGWWFKKQFRKDNNIEFKDICSVFYELKMELDAIHKAGYVIGDFNPGCVLILKKQFWNKNNEYKRLRIVDTDTMEFDQFPCAVYSMSWFDFKNIKNIKDLGKKRIYTPETDAFSFDALFFEALTTAGVYDGFHDLYDGHKARMERGLTILHPDVEYPDDAVPFDSLPKDFQTQFEEVFVKGMRRLVTEQAFMNALGLKIQPTLQARQTAVQYSKDVRVYQEVLKGMGDIIDFIVNGNTIHALVKDKDVFKYVICYEGNNQQFVIPNTSNTNYYRILDAGFIIEIPYSIQDGQVIQLRACAVHDKNWFTITTMNGLKGQPIVSGGHGMLLTAAKNYIVAKELEDLESGFEQKHMVNQNAVIKTDPVTGNTMGYIRTGMNYNWFFMRGVLSYDVDLSELENTETMKDVAVFYSENTALVVRLTEFKGALRTRFDEISLSASHQNNRLLFSRLVDNEMFKPLSSMVYARPNSSNSIIFYAGNNGIVKENLISGEVKVFQQTQKLVRKGSHLRFYKDGLAVIEDDKIAYISM